MSVGRLCKTESPGMCSDFHCRFSGVVCFRASFVQFHFRNDVGTEANLINLHFPIVVAVIM